MIGKNNPFNLRYNPLNKWKGQIGQTKGFCDFDSVDMAIRAIGILFRTYYRKYGISCISDLISRFAPPSENDTKAYIEFVCKHVGCSQSVPLVSNFNYSVVLYWMSVFEVGRSVVFNLGYDYAHICQVWNNNNINIVPKSRLRYEEK